MSGQPIEGGQERLTPRPADADEACDRFEAAWQSGGRPKLERRVEADPGGEVEEYQWRYQGGIAISNPQRHWMAYDVVNYS